MKNIKSKINVLSTFVLIIFYTSFKALAQTPTDAIMMPKGTLCNLVAYSNSRWDTYWEGATKRSNSNIGTFTSQNIMYMGALGITDKLNLMATLPYVSTSSTKSYLQGQKGIQDLSVWLKYQVLESTSGFGAVKVFATGGASTPVSNYVADFLPFSIGSHAKTVSGRLIFNYSTRMGIYLTAQGGATLRSNVKIDRNSFLFNNKLYNTDKMPVPNIGDGSISLGFLNKRFQTVVTIDRFACLSGDDIRYNDAPLLSNKMSATSVSWLGKVTVGQFSIMANIGRVLKGRNVGEATNITVGALYFFQVFKKTEPTKQ